MLGVELGQVRHEILDHRHVRQRIDLDGAVDLVGPLGAGERVGAVDIHRAGPANAFAAGAAQRQRRVDLVLDVQKTVEHHRPAIVHVDIIGVDTGFFPSSGLQR
jgi:hypothetical protein